MDSFIIQGGAPLAGSIRVQGSKNAALPLMAAALLTDQPVTLRGVPNLSDIRNMARLLAELGCEPAWDPTSDRASTETPTPMTLRVADASVSHARYDIVRTMRASISVLGPLLASRGKARVALPGGCAIGERPVDLHLHGLRALGAHITLDAGDIIAEAPAGGLRGARLFLGGPFGSTVLGTANVLSAATLAKGTTVIESAACEPEIVDLARLLNAMGARISGAGSPRITVEGVSALDGADHSVIPDRIEAGTLLAAAAATRSEIELEDCPLDALMCFVQTLRDAGIEVEPTSENQDPVRARCRVRCTADRPRPVTVTTQPHPGFPTDLQAQLMALLCLADGNSVVTEKIFPDRFLHVAELARMGASIHRVGPTAVVSGVKQLIGAPVMASDLRASACLVIAGLAARGETRINRVYHLDRGYESLETRLAAIGANIERRPEGE
ncbi:MAG: UDP-N-acetylglucosamine 1-carboxyvinyltransferase [Planctomycetota bacterium]